MRRFLWPVVASLGFIAVVFLFVLPTRTYLGQHNAINQAASQIATLKKQDQDLERQAANLRNPSEIARIASLDYGMVKPGQPATVVLPSSSSPSSGSSGKAAAKHPGHHRAVSGSGSATPPSSTTTTAP